MKKIILDLYENHIKLKIFLCAVVAVLYMALTVYSGGNLLQAAAVWAVCLGLVYLPGVLRRKVIKADRLFDGMGFMTNILLGSGFFCAAYCAFLRAFSKKLAPSSTASPSIFASSIDKSRRPGRFKIASISRIFPRFRLANTI